MLIKVPFYWDISSLFINIVPFQFFRNITVTIILLIGALFLFIRFILSTTDWKSFQFLSANPESTIIFQWPLEYKLIHRATLPQVIYIKASYFTVFYHFTVFHYFYYCIYFHFLRKCIIIQPEYPVKMF